YIYYTGGATFYNQPHSLFVNRLRSGVGSGLYFKDRLGTNVNTGGIGVRARSPLTFVSSSDRRVVPVRERPAAFPVRERPDRPNQPYRSDVRNRTYYPVHPDHPYHPYLLYRT